MHSKKLNLLFVAILFSALSLRAQVNSVFTIGNDSLHRAQHIRTLDGGVLLSGVNNLLQYVYFIKMDNANNTQWSMKVPTPAYYTLGLVRSVKLQELPDGSVIALLVQSSLVMKISPAGGLIWKREYTDVNNTSFWYYHYIYDVCITNSNTVVIVGSASPAMGVHRAWIQSMDTAGNILWSDYYAGTVSDGMDLVTKSHDGGVTVVGHSVWGTQLSMWHFSAAGNLAWAKNWDHPPVPGINFSKVIETADHSYVIAGTTSDSTNGVIMKFDSIGDYTWAHVYGDSTNTYFYDVIETAEGYVVVGTASKLFNCGVHGLIMCFDKPNGHTIWQAVAADQLNQMTNHIGYNTVEEIPSGFLIGGQTDLFSPPATGRFNAALFTTNAIGMVWCYNNLHAQPLIPMNPCTQIPVTYTKSNYTQNNYPQPLTTYPLNLNVNGGCPVGIDEVHGPEAISVYPNPANGTVTVTNCTTGTTGEIFNSTGLLVMQLPEGFQQYPIDISALPAGLYIIRTINQEGEARVAELIIY